MRSLALSSLLISAAVLAADDDVYTINCSSAEVDGAASVPQGLTKDKCVQACNTSCANIRSEDSMERCLSAAGMDGCLFEMSKVHDVDTSYCLSQSTGQAVFVYRIPAATFDADLVAVSMVAELTNPTTMAGCSSKAVEIGVADTSSVSSRNCAYAGNALDILKSYQLTGPYMTVDITDVFIKNFQAGRDLTLFTIVSDVTCGIPSLKDIDIAFTLKYKDGFRPSALCRSKTTCNNCLAQGCSWCTWSARGRNDIPDYLPDWDYIEDARDDRRGQCGVNSAVCGKSDGRANFCDASAAPARLASIAALLLTAVFFVLV